MERKITPKRGIYIGRTPDDDFCYGAFSDTDALVDSENVEDRIRMAKLGYGVDKLKNDPDPEVKAAAMQFVADWQKAEDK